ALRPVDLDDVGAELGQQPAASRAGQHLGQVEHTEAVERRRPHPPPPTPSRWRGGVYGPPGPLLVGQRGGAALPFGLGHVRGAVESRRGSTSRRSGPQWEMPAAWANQVRKRWLDGSNWT